MTNSNKKVLLSIDHSFQGAQSVIKNVKKYFPLTTEPILNQNISSKELIEKFNQQIYFIIGHGKANRKYPELSTIDISFFNTQTSLYDKMTISLRDLGSIKSPIADFVMLIGCETAVGKIYRGTGISGLHFGFLTLGVKNVIGSLWAIEDKHALNQTNEFIKLYSIGINPAKILQTIQINSISTLENDNYIKNAHPYFWGGFTYILNTSKRRIYE